MLVKETIQKYKSFFLLLFLWFVAGKLAGGIGCLVISCTTLLYFWNKGKFIEAVIGLFFLMTLSDSMSFAKTAKNIYMPILCGMILWDNLHLVISQNHIYKRLLPFFLYSLPLLYLSETPFISLQKNVSYILLFVTLPPFIYGICIESKEKTEEFLRVFFLFVGTFLLIGLILWLMGSANVYKGSRFRSLLGNPNAAGVFCMLSLFLFLTVKDLLPQLFSKQQYLAFLAIILGTLFLSGSRATLMAITFASIIYLLQLRWISSFFLLIFIVIGLDSIYSLLLWGVNEIGAQEYFRIDTLDIAGGRVHGWSFAWEQIQQNFLFGKGWAFDEYIFRKHSETLVLLNHQGGVHNSFLAVWLNTGFIGLILYSLGLFWIFYQSSKYSKWSMPFMFACLISGNFEPWLVASLNPFTIQLIISLVFQTNGNSFISQQYDFTKGYI